MLTPSALQPGDTIAITPTARKVTLTELEPAIALFTSWGLKVKFASGLFAESDQFGGNDTTRTSSLQELLDDPEVKAIVCARGGYGTVRIIDQLDFTAFKQSPKWLIGFSDVTVLHSHVFTHLQLPTVHAPMAFSVQDQYRNDESLENLRLLLFGVIPGYHTPYHPLNRLGSATGKLIGGNLSVLYSLIGSSSDIDTRNCILFLEDLDEYLYHIDRMMMNMKRSGKLDQLAGMLIGDMSDMKDNAIPFGKTAYEIIQEHVSSYDYPVAFGFPAGHEKRNLPLVLGHSYRFNVSGSGTELIA